MDWKAEFFLPVEDIYEENADILLMLLIKQPPKRQQSEKNVDYDMKVVIFRLICRTEIYSAFLAVFFIFKVI